MMSTKSSLRAFLPRSRAPWRMCLAAAVLTAWVGTPATTRAQSVILNPDESRIFADFNWLPYAFFSQSFGLGFGIGGAYSGWPEEPTSTIGAVTLGTKGSYNVALAMSDLRFPGTRRLYTRPFVMSGRYQDQFIFVGRNNAGFEGQRAGANDSDFDNRVEAIQWDNRVEVQFEYLLPIGHGAPDDEIVIRHIVERGLLKSGASGGESWNPMTSGRSKILLTPQWREQTLENDELDVPLETVNLEVGLERDNRDFPFNPSKGSYQKMAYKQDFQSDEVLGEWDLWTVELAKVINLGQTDRFRQRVLALNFWTAYVPSWETANIDGQEVITKRPPQYDGAGLGGLLRMRGYENDRFQDKAAVYYSAELRGIPNWQPLRHARLLEWANIRYWQWVLFLETGQVSPHWNVSDLHSDLHVDGGIGLRGMVHKAVVRLDVAAGDEGVRVTAMYGHPF